jgi:hypothetical protein
MVPGIPGIRCHSCHDTQRSALVGMAWSGGAGVTAEVTRQAAAERFPDHQPLAASNHCTS